MELRNKAYGELELVFPREEHKEQVENYLKEHFENGEYHLNGVGGLDKIKDFEEWLHKIQDENVKEKVKEGRVQSTLYLGIRKSDNRIIGTIQIRHELNEYLLNIGGHIGDGVRPSERRKGYATEMIRLALEKCKEIGLDKVLITCNKDNIGSRKSIQNNGGILENETLDEIGKELQRFWIELK